MFDLRRIAERLSRDVVLTRTLPRDFGSLRLFVSPEGGGLKYWRWDLGKVDPNLLRAVDIFVRPGASVWDVGANMGLFTFAAASRVGPSGHVLGIEPDVDNVRLLNRTRGTLPQTCGHVDILPVALNRGDSRVARLAISVRARASNALEAFGSSQQGGVREIRTVAALCMDDLLEFFAAPSVLKMDVEGAEAEVLEGGTQLLERHRPVLILEVSRDSAESVATRLSGLGYRFFDSDATRPFDRALPVPPWGCFAVPDERLREFSSVGA